MEAYPYFSHVPKFCFPDVSDSEGPELSELDETYSFTLTNDKGVLLFGYCRRVWPDVASPLTGRPQSTGAMLGATGQVPKLADPTMPTVYCILSFHRCFDLFDKVRILSLIPSYPLTASITSASVCIRFVPKLRR